MLPHLTASLEDYLEAIAELISCEGHAHTKEIAKKLNVKMPSVTGALRQLEKLGYIIYNAHYPVELTPEGTRVAAEVVRRHSILKKFFVDILGVSPEKASATACHLEHVVDSDIIERFILFSKSIENRSDARQLQTFLTEAIFFLNDENFKEAVTLAELSSGAPATIIRLGRNISTSGTLPVSEHDVIVFQGFSLDKTSLRIKKEEEIIDLPLNIAENIWVMPGK